MESTSMNDIPVIKLFIEQGMFYVYDTYTNKVINITKAQFEEIKCLENCGNSKYRSLHKNTVEYNDVLLLMNKGFFQSSFISHVDNSLTEYVDLLIQRSVNELVLQVTKDCNFKCRYCLFTRENDIDRCHEKVNMPWEIARKSLDILYSHSADANTISISFYGGEPLLNFELIKKVVSYADDLFQSKKIHYSMTTNGSLLSQDIINFLIKHEISVGISLDGPMDIQNKHRKFYKTGDDTFSFVYNNVCRLRAADLDYFNEHVTFQPVHMLDENINEVRCFFNSMNLLPNKVLIRDASVDGIDYVYSDYELIDKEPSEKQQDVSKYDKIITSKSSIPARWHHSGPCVPGFRKLFVDTNGIFYPCEKVLETTANKIGDVFSEFDIGRIKEILNVGKLTEDDCKCCWAARFCSICAVECLDVEKDALSKSKKLISCKRQKEKALEYLKEYVQR